MYPIPVNSIINPNKNPIIVIIPNFFTFVKNNSKIMPPTSGTKTERRTKKSVSSQAWQRQK